MRAGGRKKGTLNKKTQDQLEIAKKHKISPFEILLFFASGDWKALGFKSETKIRYTSSGEGYEVPHITPEHRLKAASECCQYLYPKRKSIQITNDINTEDPAAHLSDEELDEA